MSESISLKDLDSPIVIEPVKQATSAVIWLHGLGADGNDFVGVLPQLALPEDHAVRFVFPHAPIQPVTVNGGMAMRSWYDIVSMEIADRADLAGIEQSRSIVEELIYQQLQQGIKPENLILAGFSQGGLVALHTALNSEYDFAGVMALSTYYPSACLSENSRTQQVFMAHGVYDQVIPLAVAQQAKQLLEQLQCELVWQTYPMEHQVCQPELEAIANWLKDRL